MKNRVFVAVLVAFVYHAAEKGATSWNYINGGLDWPTETNSCGGKSQSPIALDPVKAVAIDEFYFDFEFNNRGENTTIEPTPHISMHGEFSFLKFKNANGTLLEYDAIQMHFHSPGEHYVNGRLYDAELHIVHQIKPEYQNSTTYKYAVVGLLFEAGENQSSKFIKSLNLADNSPNRFVDLQKFLWDDFKQLSTIMHYQGSLTTPGCAEIVNWFVFTTPLKMGISELTAMDLNFRGNRSFANGRGNNRLIQQLNGRTVTLFNYKQKVVANLLESEFFRSYIQELIF
jgi:carbonic anhydrase